MRLLLPIVMAVSLSATVATAQESLPPQEFAKQAALSNMFGVESATLALHKTASPEIKNFAHRLANDLTTAGSGLRQITARRSDIALPERPDSRHFDMLRDLADRQGEDFDRAYVKVQRAVHEEAVLLVSSYAQNGGDPELKAFAAKSLPTLEKLNDKAKELPSPP
jgi:putative membrane protein